MKTFLDWSSYHEAGMGDPYADIPRSGGDFAKAVAVCIKSGLCEQADRKGVMCPSFRVNHESDQSTGGRIRLLKMALNGELGELAFTDKALAKTMETCVACKGCKRECENAVDMAMLKIEYLAQRQAITGLTRRTKLFGRLADWLHRYRWLKYLPALHNRLPFVARLNARLLGISSTSKLPESVASIPSFRDTSPADPKGEVVLLVDTFTRNFQPDNATAALSVLESAGYRVFVAQSGTDQSALCCGRTHLAHGLVDEAKGHAARMLDVLCPHAEAGRQIIGLEPACLLAVRDDYRFLGLGRKADEVAAKAVLFEEFVARETSAKRFALNFKHIDRQVLVHGHCHQKAVGAMKSMRKVLKLLPGLKFDIIETSCCGMAGSFGIEAEHAEMANKMAELKLLPTLREQPDALVVANGFSCQHQIRSNCLHDPVHLAVLLREAMA